MIALSSWASRGLFYLYLLFSSLDAMDDPALNHVAFGSNTARVTPRLSIHCAYALTAARGAVSIYIGAQPMYSPLYRNAHAESRLSLFNLGRDYRNRQPVRLRSRLQGHVVASIVVHMMDYQTCLTKCDKERVWGCPHDQVSLLLVDSSLRPTSSLWLARLFQGDPALYIVQVMACDQRPRRCILSR